MLTCAIAAGAYYAKVTGHGDLQMPSGQVVPSALPLCRKNMSKGPVPRTCSKNSLIIIKKKRAWATGFAATIFSIVKYFGMSGHSSTNDIE